MGSSLQHHLGSHHNKHIAALMMSGGKRAALPSDNAIRNNLDSKTPAEQDNLLNSVAEIKRILWQLSIMLLSSFS